jgi:hypothetical protein
MSKNKAIVNVSGCKYSIVRKCFEDCNLKVSEDEDYTKSHVIWSDTGVIAETMKVNILFLIFRKLNHGKRSIISQECLKFVEKII